MDTYFHRLRRYFSNGDTKLFPLPDIVLVAVLSFVLLLIGAGSNYDKSTLTAFLFVLANFSMLVPLLLRRTRPMLMLWLMVPIGLWQLMLFNYASPSLIAVPIASYSIARWADSEQSRTVLVVGLLASISSALRWCWGPSNGVLQFLIYSSIVFFVCFAAVLIPYLLGRRTFERVLVEQERVQASRARYQAEIDRLEQETRITEARVRSDIARELHDVVAHSLSVIIVQADGGKALLTKKPEAAAEALTTIGDTGREALSEMRRIVGVLREGPASNAEYVPNPGLSEIAAMVHRAGDRVELIIKGEEPAVPATLGLTAYRIVQEGVTNFLKHAGESATARVTIAYTPDLIKLQIADNGRGSSPINDSGGYGLRGMRERVNSMGGYLDAGPGVGGGYLVKATLPIPRSTSR